MSAFVRLGLPVETPPMEARLVSELPDGDGWQFEPKWDGFRCLVYRDGDDIALMSKSGKPLARYFPEVVAMIAAMAEDRMIVDGELVLPVGEVLSFEDLQLRLHPAASRIERLSRERPARLMVFDCLQRGEEVLAARPLAERRGVLKGLARGFPDGVLLSPITLDRAMAERWLAAGEGALDGIVAKRSDAPYAPGERTMAKFKQRRTADCVIGGFRLDERGTTLASLLLGLYDAAGRLHHVGFVSGLSAGQRSHFLPLLEAVAGPSPFDGSAPGGPSRWNKGRSTEWHPLRPELVIEVGYDQVTGDRLRHGATFLRWRPDKAPPQCTMDQLRVELRPAELEALLRSA